MLNHGVLGLNNTEGVGIVCVPWVGQSRSGLPCNDDITADMKNKCDLFIQVSDSRQEQSVGLAICKLQSRKFGGLIDGEREGHLSFFSFLPFFLSSFLPSFLLSFLPSFSLSLSLSFVFLQPYLWHMEIPRLEVESEL